MYYIMMLLIIILAKINLIISGFFYQHNFIDQSIKYLNKNFNFKTENTNYINMQNNSIYQNKNYLDTNNKNSYKEETIEEYNLSKLPKLTIPNNKNKTTELNQNLNKNENKKKHSNKIDIQETNIINNKLNEIQGNTNKYKKLETEHTDNENNRLIDQDILPLEKFGEEKIKELETKIEIKNEVKSKLQTIVDKNINKKIYKNSNQNNLDLDVKNNSLTQINEQYPKSNIKEDNEYLNKELIDLIKIKNYNKDTKYEKYEENFEKKDTHWLKQTNNNTDYRNQINKHHYYKISYPPNTIYKRNYNKLNKHLPKKIYLEDYKNLIFKIIEKDKINVLNTLISIVGSTEIRNNNGDTPLIYAIKKNKINSIRYLIMKGSNIDAKDNKGNTAFLIALQNKRNDIINIIKEVEKN